MLIWGTVPKKYFAVIERTMEKMCKLHLSHKLD